jgi:prophage maintenance system killer protein
MKSLFSQIPFAALLIYLSFNGIEINSHQYWIVSGLVILYGCAVLWARERK